MKKFLITTFLILVFVINALAESPTESLLIVVLDSSPSVRPYWSDMQISAQELIRNAPERAAVGVVGIDAEAKKSDVFPQSRRGEGIDFVQKLNIGGRLTDLARGTDATLALIQQANPTSCVIVYITDGKLVVPKNFRNQGSFFDLLRREFAPRPKVEVVVINVKGDQSAQREPLPSNVRIISLKSSNELRETIAQRLTPTINERLVPVVVTSQPQSEQISRPARRWLKVGVPGFVMLLAIILGVILWMTRRNRNAGETPETVVADQPPPDLLRAEDLLVNEEPANVCLPPVALVMASDSTRHSGDARRRVLNVGEQTIVGGYRFADLQLPGLKQTRTLQVRFDGKVVTVFRLRPQPGEQLDEVLFNQANAPSGFRISDKDVLKVGSFTLNFIITDHDRVPESWRARDTSLATQSNTQLSTTGRRPALDTMRGQRHDNANKRSEK